MIEQPTSQRENPMRDGVEMRVDREVVISEPREEAGDKVVRWRGRLYGIVRWKGDIWWT